MQDYEKIFGLNERGELRELLQGYEEVSPVVEHRVQPGRRHVKRLSRLTTNCRVPCSAWTC